MMDTLIEIILRGKGSSISSDFAEPLIIPVKDYQAQIGLKSFATYNNIPNVAAEKNNQIKIKVPGDNIWYTFKLETGAYELQVIAEQMVEWIKIKFPKLEDVEDKFQLLGNKATSKAEFCFYDDYGVDFGVASSMYKLLGFGSKDKFEGTGKYVAKEIVNITDVTQLIFNCNITTGNYKNGKLMPFLYNCGVDVPSGYRLGRELTKISYKNLNTTQISHICIWIVDERGVPVNLREEDLIVTLSLRIHPHVPSVKVQQVED